MANRRIPWTLLFTALLLCLYGTSKGGAFSYENFNSPTGLIFQADAALFKDRLRLTPAAGGKVGGVWWHSKAFVKDGFDLTFQFQITQPGGHGADGLAFVVQNNATPVLGQSGSNLGFTGITNSLVIKLDNYHWHGKAYVKYDEIAVTVGRPFTGDESENARSMASVTNKIVFSDGRVHAARILYAPGNLQVFLDDLENPAMTYYVNLTRVMSLDQGRAWVGLTAATGADHQNHDVLNWRFAARNADAGAKVNISRASTPAARTSEPTIQTVPAASAPDSFLYPLPAAVNLAHRIESSTDLVHWKPMTNLVLYFTDPESGNYDRRFYRFLAK